MSPGFPVVDTHAHPPALLWRLVMKHSQMKWIAFLAGIIFGLIVGFYFWFTTTTTLRTVAVMALASGVAFAVMTNTIIEWRVKIDATPSKVGAKVSNCYVSEWKLRWLRHLLIEDKNNPESSEREILHVEDWHWIKLVRDIRLRLSVTLFLLWGSMDFPGHEQLWDWFVSTLRPDNISLREVIKPLSLLLLIAGYVWYLRRTGKLKDVAKKSTGPILVMLVGLWGLIGFPGAVWLQEAFESGSPMPWLYAALVALVATLLGSVDYIFGFVLVTRQRIVRGRVPLPFLRKVVDPLNFENIVGGAIHQSPLGNILGYGEVVAKEQGEQESEMFHHLKPLKHFEELAGVINLMTQRRHPA